jgi:hypothetical protein
MLGLIIDEYTGKLPVLSLNRAVGILYSSFSSTVTGSVNPSDQLTKVGSSLTGGTILFFLVLE